MVYTLSLFKLCQFWMNEIFHFDVPWMKRLKNLMLKFEILLPLYYNDGRRIEEGKFTRTDEDIWITAQLMDVI